MCQNVGLEVQHAHFNIGQQHGDGARKIQSDQPDICVFDLKENVKVRPAETSLRTFNLDRSIEAADSPLEAFAEGAIRVLETVRITQTILSYPTAETLVLAKERG